jgi:HYR domain
MNRDLDNAAKETLADVNGMRVSRPFKSVGATARAAKRWYVIRTRTFTKVAGHSLIAIFALLAGGDAVVRASLTLSPPGTTSDGALNITQSKSLFALHTYLQAGPGSPGVGFLGLLTRAEVSRLSAVSSEALPASTATSIGTAISSNRPTISRPGPIASGILAPSSPNYAHIARVDGAIAFPPDTTTRPTVAGIQSDMTVEATGANGAVVNYQPPTVLDVDGNTVAVSCLPASGSTFVLGTTTVMCSSTHTHGNGVRKTFTVTVQNTSVVDENFLTMKDVLDPNITFSRASTATFVGSNGLIQTARNNTPRFDYNPSTLTLDGLLIEQSGTNQQLDSSFNIAFGGVERWGGLINASLTPDSALAPDGAMNAATIIDNSTDAAHAVYYANGAFAQPAGGQQNETCSVYLKAGTLGSAQLQLYEGANGAGLKVDIDLEAGKLANGGTIGSSSKYLGSSIIPYPGGIYRVSLSGSIPNPQNLYCYPITENSLGNTSYSGSGGTIFAWGADIESNMFPTSYLYTASIANQQLDSNDLSEWTSGGLTNSVLTPNAETAPDGTATAAQIADNSTNSVHGIYHGNGLGGVGLIPTTGQYYATTTCSMFLKAGSQRYAELRCGNGGGSFVNGEVDSGVKVDADLDNGTIANGETFGVTGGDQTSYIGSDIEALPNAQFPDAPAGWYRLSVTGVIIVENTVYIEPYLASTLGIISYAGNNSSLFAWGPQVEQGATSTDYVPVGTVPGGTTMRAPDLATQSLSGLPNFANGLSWIFSGITAPGTSTTQVAAELDDGSPNNRITLERASNGHLQFVVVSGGAMQATLDMGAVANRTAFRVGLNAKSSSFAATINGGTFVTGTGSMPASLTTARYGSDTTGNYWDGWLRESKLWASQIRLRAQF